MSAVPARRPARVAALVLLAVAALAPTVVAKPPKVVERPPGPAPEEGGRARGKFRNNEEVSPFQYAYAVAVPGRRGAPDEIHVVFADRRVPKEALDDLEALSTLGAEGEVRAVELVLGPRGEALRALFHHPGLPSGISVQGVAWEVEAKGLPDGPVKGSFEFDLPDEYSWSATATFETPIYRPVRAPAPEIPADAPPADRARLELAADGIDATEEELLDRAFSGDEEIVARLLAAGVSANARGGRGSALDDAITQKHPAVAKLLLAAGADANEKLDEYGTTILHRAVDTGDATFVAALLDAGADPSVANRYRITPLMSASLEGRLDMVELLIARGAKVTARDTGGGTALSSAVLRGHLEVARALLAAGADARRDRDLLLDLARREGHAELEKLILAATAGSGG